MEREWSVGGAWVERRLVLIFSKAHTFTVHDPLARDVLTDEEYARTLAMQ